MAKRTLPEKLFFGLLLLLSASCTKFDRDLPPTPKGMIFKSWYVQDIPATNAAGNVWDVHDNSGPDIQFSLTDDAFTIYKSDIIENTEPGKRYEIDIDPDIQLDSLCQGWWRLDDKLEPYSWSDRVTSGEIHALAWHRSLDSIILRSQNPKVVLRVEYFY